VALVVALAPPAWAAEPDASTRAAARKIALEGVTALQADNADLASQKLEKAFQLLPAPSIALWSARALAKRGLLVEAAERYVLAGRLPSSEGNEQAVQVQAQRDAARELAELSPRIPKLVLTLEGAKPSEVQITMDGKAVSSALIGEEQPANPGAHRVLATRGREKTDQPFSLVESQRGQVVLRFHGPAPETEAASPVKGSGSSPEWSTYSPSGSSSGTTRSGGGSKGGSSALGIVTLVLGGAGLATGGVTAGLAMKKRNDLVATDDCTKDSCSASRKSEVENFRMLRTVSSVGFIAGGVLAATGIVLLVASSSSSKRAEVAHPTLALRVAPTDVSLMGQF
jgi:hypothetical protein